MTLNQELECLAERHGICLFAFSYMQALPDDDGEIVEILENVRVADCMGVKRKRMKALRRSIKKAFLKRVDEIMKDGD